MTETVKKTTTRKPKTTSISKPETATNGKLETAAKVEASAKPVKVAAKTNGKANGKLDNLTVMPSAKAPSYDQIAALAHRYWAERGFQHGADAADWFRAEQELRSKAS